MPQLYDTTGSTGSCSLREDYGSHQNKCSLLEFYSTAILRRENVFIIHMHANSQDKLYILPPSKNILRIIFLQKSNFVKFYQSYSKKYQHPQYQ
jgi:hypothetical protein